MMQKAESISRLRDQLRHNIRSIVVSDSTQKLLHRLETLNNLQVSISISEGRIVIMLNSDTAKGSVYCEKMIHNPTMIIESSNADSGIGPILYDLAIEMATLQGCDACSDRKTVSDDAYAVWQYYYYKRSDIQKYQQSPGLWYMGAKADTLLSTMTKDESTWPKKEHPVWSLWHSYSKQPELVSVLLSKGALELT